MKKEPKFKPGDRVFFNDTRRGTIVECINQDEPADIRLQGFRYYIQARQMWSIREDAIDILARAKSTT